MHCEPTSMSSDKLSPRPSPQHSKSLTAPLDCTNCSKQQSNPINNYISKWKYKDDLAKPLNVKRTRPRKQPQTTYHFPLSHTSVNTFNPNNKQNENEATPPTTPDTPSPTDSPRDISPRDPSPREVSPRNISPRNSLSPRTSLSPRASLSPRSSPRQVSREILLKHHRAQLQAQEHPQKRQDEREYAHTHACDPPMPNAYQRQYENSQEGQSYDYHMSSPKRHRQVTHLTLPPDSSLSPRSVEISSICNPTYDSPSPPHSSDDNDDSYSSDTSPYTGNHVVRDSRKRRSSEEGMECETIEISDGESEYLTLPTPPYHNARTFQSRRFTTLDPPRVDTISLHPLSLNSAHSDLAKYHFEPPRRTSPTLPPLNFARLPSIAELWPIDDTNPRLQQFENTRHRSQSFPSYYTC